MTLKRLIRLPIHQVDIALAAVIGREHHPPPVGRERRMRVGALIFPRLIRVVPAQHLEHLLPIAQMHFGNAAGARFAVGDHGLAGGVEVVLAS